jgi:tetratricopeptide (TPR) repeat protein
MRPERDLTPEIARYEALIREGRNDEAVALFRERLDKPTLYGLAESLQRGSLLSRLDVEKLSKDADKLFVWYHLALTMNLTGGYPNRAVPVYERHDALAESVGDEPSLAASLGHHAKALRQIGRFFEAETLALKGLRIIRRRRDFLREAVNLYWLGMGLAQRGEAADSEIALRRSLRIFQAKFAAQSEGVANAFLAQRALWLEDYEAALSCSEAAFNISAKLENDPAQEDLHGAAKVFIAAARMKGEALVRLGSRAEGEDLLHLARRRARAIEFVEEELPALRALALNALANNDLAAARNYLAQTWPLAERGQFLLYHADARNTLARVELAAGNIQAAQIAALQGFTLSVCDGPPFAYRRGLEDAKKILAETGAESPATPLCNQQAQDIGPELNPPDEFGV